MTVRGPVRAVEGIESGPLAVVALTGEVDLANAAAARADLMAFASNEIRGMIVDLTDLEFIDSSGVRVLFDLSRLLRDHGQDLHLVVPPSSGPERTLNLSGMGRAATLYATLDEARAAAG